MPRPLVEESWRHSFLGILKTRLMHLLPAFMCFSFNGEAYDTVLLHQPPRLAAARPAAEFLES